MSEAARAAIFDLDGVLTSTSARHEQSWREAAERFGFPVTAESLRATRSVPRASSLTALLEHAGITLAPPVHEAVMSFKNSRYRELIANLQPSDAFPGAHRTLMDCRALGLRIAVASASQNASVVLKRLDLLELIDYVADSRLVPPKPSAAIYGLACHGVGARPGDAICVEDGAPMIANLRAAGLYTVGIGPVGLGAHEQCPDIASWNIAATLARLGS